MEIRLLVWKLLLKEWNELLFFFYEKKTAWSVKYVIIMKFTDSVTSITTASKLVVSINKPSYHTSLVYYIFFSPLAYNLHNLQIHVAIGNALILAIVYQRYIVVRLLSWE